MIEPKRELVQLRDKPLEEMSLEELYSERACHQWARYKILNAKKMVAKKKWWLEQNKPILSKEEITQQYENGEITQKQYKTAFALRKRAINYRMRVLDYMDYADKFIFAEESLVAYIDELIAQKLSAAAIGKKMPKHKKYNPRQRAGRSNQPKNIDPQQKWATRQAQGEFPKLVRARRRWKAYTANDRPVLTVSRRMQPIISWDTDKLMAVARDRGFYTDVAVKVAIGDALNISAMATAQLLNSGKLSWNQCIVIGSLFEMTPKEFCDIFMSGYFIEVADGVYRAKVDDYDTMLDAPYKAKVRGKDETDSNVDSDNGGGVVCLCGNDGNT